MKSLSSLKINEFLELLGKGSPSPAGGCAAALSGSAAAGLAEMTARLAWKKEKDPDTALEIERWVLSASNIRKRLLELLDEDSKVFTSIIEARKLPEETREEREIKEIIQDRAGKKAVEVPLEILERCRDLALCIEAVAGRGIPGAVEDETVAEELAKAAAYSVSGIIKANLVLLKDRDYAETAVKRAEELKEEIGHLLIRADKKRNSVSF
jgi:formiminotetrahydrofolate cyclodeaminase